MGLLMDLAVVEVLPGLPYLLLRIHHEGPALHYRLPMWDPCEEQEARSLLLACDDNFGTLSQDCEMTLPDLDRIAIGVYHNRPAVNVEELILLFGNSMLEPATRAKPGVEVVDRV